MRDTSKDFMDDLDANVVTAIESRLATRCGSVPSRLTGGDIKVYDDRGFVAGWRVPVVFADGRTRRVDVLLSPWFPTVAPRTALVDHPGRLTWPHVESDGVLCLLSNSHDLDVTDPVNVIDNLMARSCLLIDQLIDGAIIERDFKQEFLTYWDYDLNDPRRIHSLVDAEGPTRQIAVWHGATMSVVGESDEQVQSWLKNRFPGISERELACEKACFLWLDSPPVPSEYPQDPAGLLELAMKAGPEATQLLQAAGNEDRSSLTVIIGAEGRGGAGLIGVQAIGSERKRDKRTRERGFRKGNVPETTALMRLFNTAKIARRKVLRAEQAWVHGRGRDERSVRLASKSAVVFGCGSIGGTVAVTLLKAGVGDVAVVDTDELDWANISRHELGGSSVGRNKALELAERLQRDFPHARVRGYDHSVQSAIEGGAEWLSTADLILSATGSGQADKALNNWHKLTGRKVPVLYGWAEPFGVAGHAVAIGTSGSCLDAIVNAVGLATLELTKFAGGVDVEEPACGMHYAPYGAIELASINTLVAELAIDCLLGRMSGSLHRAWAGRRALLEENRGEWTTQALALLGGQTKGGTLLERRLPSCQCCSQKGLRYSAPFQTGARP